MLSLVEQNALLALRENLPSKSGNLMFLVFPKNLSQVRNILATSLPEGTHYQEGYWEVPGGDKVFLRTFQNQVPKNLPEYDLVVCTDGDVVPAEDWAPLKDWRKRDALT